MKATTIVGRQELHNEIWSEPVLVVAARYGISDAGLAKICRRHRIPVPGRGHWQRLRAGRRTRLAPLPPAREGEPERVVIARSSGREIADGVRVKQPALQSVVVPPQLSDPHPEIAKAEGSLRSAKADERGIIRARSTQRLDIRVSQGTLDRALRIMDALLKALLATGYRVTIGDGSPSTECVPSLVEKSRWCLQY
jgi:hypothetical protein